MGSFLLYGPDFVVNWIGISTARGPQICRR